ncbi:MAG: homoserine kinase [Alphaproteobacteria bacterium]|nr:homoserine kinase [Alphaproteobacteria bacterium]
MAVYTKVTETELSEFLKQFDIGSLVSLTGISEGIENTNYLVQTDKARFILTLYEKRVNPQELPYFMDLMTYLAQKGISCPLPVATKTGETLSPLCGKKACLTTFLNGKSVTKILPEHCAELGQAMAKMHLAGQNFSGFRKNDLSVDGWEVLLGKIGKEADTITDGLFNEMTEVFRTVKSLFPAGLPQGVIHADLFPDNVFFTDDKLSGIIDFYFACNDALVYELAVCLNAWCFDQDTWDFNPAKAKNMIEEYNRVRPLSAEEKETLPILALGSALRFLLTRTYDWLNRVPGALVTPKNPLEYVKKLRFHKKIHDYREYLK